MWWNSWARAPWWWTPAPKGIPRQAHSRRGVGSLRRKSLKDVAFNPEQDDFKALETLDRSKALIFSCNGAECWKSYKAAKVAADKGFSQRLLDARRPALSGTPRACRPKGLKQAASWFESG